MDLESHARMMLALQSRRRLTPSPARLLVDGHDILQGNPAGQILCSCRKKFMPVEEVKIGHSSVFPFRDGICDACLKDRPTHARIICFNCREVVARHQPWRYPSGFTIAANGCYHTPACPTCQPNLVGTILMIVERSLYERERNK